MENEKKKHQTKQKQMDGQIKQEKNEGEEEESDRERETKNYARIDKQQHRIQSHLKGFCRVRKECKLVLAMYVLHLHNDWSNKMCVHKPSPAIPPYHGSRCLVLAHIQAHINIVMMQRAELLVFLECAGQKKKNYVLLKRRAKNNKSLHTHQQRRGNYRTKCFRL